jgi:hypothetical protein
MELGRLLGLVILRVLPVTRPGTFILPIQTITQSERLLLLRRLLQQSLGWPGRLVQPTELAQLLGFNILGMLNVTQEGLFILPIQAAIQSASLRKCHTSKITRHIRNEFATQKVRPG